MMTIMDLNILTSHRYIYQPNNKRENCIVYSTPNTSFNLGQRRIDCEDLLIMFHKDLVKMSLAVNQPMLPTRNSPWKCQNIYLSGLMFVIDM